MGGAAIAGAGSAGTRPPQHPALPRLTCSVAKSLGAKTVAARALECTRECRVLSEVVEDAEAVSAVQRFLGERAPPGSGPSSPWSSPAGHGRPGAGGAGGGGLPACSRRAFARAVPPSAPAPYACPRTEGCESPWLLLQEAPGLPPQCPGWGPPVHPRGPPSVSTTRPAPWGGAAVQSPRCPRGLSGSGRGSGTPRKPAGEDNGGVETDGWVDGGMDGHTD